jgi:hypothetical protein
MRNCGDLCVKRGLYLELMKLIEHLSLHGSLTSDFGELAISPYISNELKATKDLDSFLSLGDYPPRKQLRPTKC